MMTVLETSSRGNGFVNSATLRLTGPSRKASLSMFLSTSRTRLHERDLRAFGVVFALVIVATFASALAWSGVGLVAFVPLVGLAVFPLQLAALIVRGFVFEYLGLTALGAYVTLYLQYLEGVEGTEHRNASPATAVDRSRLTRALGRPA